MDLKLNGIGSVVRVLRYLNSLMKIMGCLSSCILSGRTLALSPIMLSSPQNYVIIWFPL